MFVNADTMAASKPVSEKWNLPNSPCKTYPYILALLPCNDTERVNGQLGLMMATASLIRKKDRQKDEVIKVHMQLVWNLQSPQLSLFIYLFIIYYLPSKELLTV